jgi:hypothetical protein
MDPRYLVVGPQGEAEMLSIQAFHDASFGVGGEAILEGRLTRRLGFGIAMDQNVGTITQAAGPVDVTVNFDESASSKTVSAAAGSSEFAVGALVDIATISGNFVITSVTGTGGSAVYGIEPALPAGASGGPVAMTDAAGVTTGEAYEANMAFHRDFAAFVTRPLAAGAEGLGTVVRSISDPESRLTLRLEISRENKQTRWCWDILYGFALIRRELGCRVGGTA